MRKRCHAVLVEGKSEGKYSKMQEQAKAHTIHPMELPQLGVSKPKDNTENKFQDSR